MEGDQAVSRFVSLKLTADRVGPTRLMIKTRMPWETATATLNPSGGSFQSNGNDTEDSMSRNNTYLVVSCPCLCIHTQQSAIISRVPCSNHELSSSNPRGLEVTPMDVGDVRKPRDLYFFDLADRILLQSAPFPFFSYRWGRSEC